MLFLVIQTCLPVPCHLATNNLLFLNSQKRRLTWLSQTCSNSTRKAMVSYSCSSCGFFYLWTPARKDSELLSNVSLPKCEQKLAWLGRGSILTRSWSKLAKRYNPDKHVLWTYWNQKDRNSNKSWIIYSLLINYKNKIYLSSFTLDRLLTYWQLPGYSVHSNPKSTNQLIWKCIYRILNGLCDGRILLG